MWSDLNKVAGEPLMTKFILSAACFAAFLISFTGCSPAPNVSVNESAGEKGSVLEVASQQDFASMVEQSSIPVLVDFWATWCGPCISMNPVIKTTSARHQNRLRVVKVDVDQNKELAGSLNIRAIPTLMLYHNGSAIAQFEGAMNEKQLDGWIASQLERAGVSLAAPVM
jgi:thioredoxin